MYAGSDIIILKKIVFGTLLLFEKKNIFIKNKNCF